MAGSLPLVPCTFGLLAAVCWLLALLLLLLLLLILLLLLRLLLLLLILRPKEASES